jgi:NadR type nicotinamide-nucleotide adenylyltransferase
VEKNTQSKGKKIIKIAIVGPESTGKTVLAESLARHFQTEWVPEYARDYLDIIRRPYTKDDLETIAIEQLNLENQLEKRANRLLFCDTTLLVIKIWCEFKYRNCPEWIIDEVKHRHYDLHLLTATDIPWTPDPLREHPNVREFLYNLYRNELENLGIDYVEIRGSYEERFKNSVDQVNFLLSN